MDHNDSAIPIVFISDSKHASLESDELKSVRAYVDQDDKAGIEEMITFLTQYQQAE